LADKPSGPFSREKGKKEAAGAPTPAAKLNNFKHTGGVTRHCNEADNCCSPLHENTNLRPVFVGMGLPAVAPVQN
jgi:hypothetical protein